MSTCEWSGVPQRYRNAELMAKTTPQKKLISRLVGGKGLLVCGDIGTGKTHLACAYINELCKIDVHAKYITEYAFADLFTTRHSKETWTAMTSNREIDHCKSYRVLVVDEVGKRELTKNQQIELDELISERYNNELRTIFITNMHPKEFKERIGDRAYDRLKEMDTVTVVVSGESLRGTL